MTRKRRRGLWTPVLAGVGGSAVSLAVGLGHGTWEAIAIGEVVTSPLGLLAERGPMHGHQIRRTGELTNAEVWGGITGGAIYAELRRLLADNLVRQIREDQVGRRPARTIYDVTDERRIELIVQRRPLSTPCSPPLALSRWCCRSLPVAIPAS